MEKIVSLFMVCCEDCGVEGVEFYWAESEEEAKKRFLIRRKTDEDEHFLQFVDEPEEFEGGIVVERVWASNSQAEYRGYVTMEG